jgi:hypothetical protein
MKMQPPTLSHSPSLSLPRWLSDRRETKPLAVREGNVSFQGKVGGMLEDQLGLFHGLEAVLAAPSECDCCRDNQSQPSTAGGAAILRVCVARLREMMH